MATAMAMTAVVPAATCARIARPASKSIGSIIKAVGSLIAAAAAKLSAIRSSDARDWSAASTELTTSSTLSMSSA